MSCQADLWTVICFDSFRSLWNAIPNYNIAVTGKTTRFMEFQVTNSRQEHKFLHTVSTVAVTGLVPINAVSTGIVTVRIIRNAQIQHVAKC